MSTALQTLNVTVGSMTDVGGRDHNEDSLLVTELADDTYGPGSAWLLAVADGMGGHEGGEIASKLAIDQLKRAFESETTADVASVLKRAFRQANDAIYQQGGTDDVERRMGTTLVSAVIRGRNMTVANLGDSRAYVMRGKQWMQVTEDHTFVAEQVRQGNMTEDDARQSERRHVITRALGLSSKLDSRMPDIREMALLPEDRVLLCSDGFNDVLEQQDLQSLMAGDDPGESARALTALANDRQTTDNVTAIVVAVGASETTIKRQELSRELAESAPSSPFANIWIPVAALLAVLAIIAVAIYFYM